MTKMSRNSKRYECAVLLRDAAWALKRYADRIERCCTENPNDENERKALIWLARARERLNKFSKSRREYIPRVEITNEWWNKVLALAFQNFGRFPPKVRNPWRAGRPPKSSVATVFAGPGRVFRVFVDHTGMCYSDSKNAPFKPLAWRPA